MATQEQMTAAADRRARLLDLIEQSWRDQHRGPTTRELATQTGTVHRNIVTDLRYLEAAGAVTRAYHDNGRAVPGTTRVTAP